MIIQGVDPAEVLTDSLPIPGDDAVTASVADDAWLQEMWQMLDNLHQESGLVSLAGSK